MANKSKYISKTSMTDLPAAQQITRGPEQLHSFTYGMNAASSVVPTEVISWITTHDLARTAGGRIIQYLYNQAFLHYPDKAKMSRLIEQMREALYLLADIVRSSPEFSLCDSLDRLKQYLPVNPVFEHTLKGNAENRYCRTYIAELFDGCYFREFELYARYALTGEKNQEEWNSVTEEFYRTPLEQYRPDCGKYLAMLPESIKKLSVLARQLCNREQ